MNLDMTSMICQYTSCLYQYNISIELMKTLISKWFLSELEINQCLDWLNTRNIIKIDQSMKCFSISEFTYIKEFSFKPIKSIYFFIILYEELNKQFCGSDQEHQIVLLPHIENAIQAGERNKKHFDSNPLYFIYLFNQLKFNCAFMLLTAFQQPKAALQAFQSLQNEWFISNQKYGPIPYLKSIKRLIQGYMSDCYFALKKYDKNHKLLTHLWYNLQAGQETSLLTNPLEIFRVLYAFAMNYNALGDCEKSKGCLQNIITIYNWNPVKEFDLFPIYMLLRDLETKPELKLKYLHQTYLYSIDHSTDQQIAVIAVLLGRYYIESKENEIAFIYLKDASIYYEKQQDHCSDCKKVYDDINLAMSAL